MSRTGIWPQHRVNKDLSTIKIIVADDHALFRDGLRIVFEAAHEKCFKGCEHGLGEFLETMGPQCTLAYIVRGIVRVRSGDIFAYSLCTSGSP
jgi:hypothetical protein